MDQFEASHVRAICTSAINRTFRHHNACVVCAWTCCPAPYVGALARHVSSWFCYSLLTLTRQLHFCGYLKFTTQWLL